MSSQILGLILILILIRLRSCHRLRSFGAQGCGDVWFVSLGESVGRRGQIVFV